MEGQLVGSEIHGFRTLQGMYKFLSLFFFFFFICEMDYFGEFWKWGSLNFDY